MGTSVVEGLVCGLIVVVAATDVVSAAIDVVSAAANVVSAAADVVSAAANVVSAAADVVSACRIFANALVMVGGDGDYDFALKLVFLLNEATRGAHVLSAAAVQEPGVSPRQLALSDGCIRRVGLQLRLLVWHEADGATLRLVARCRSFLALLSAPSAAARPNPIATNDSMCAADGSATGGGGGGWHGRVGGGERVGRGVERGRVSEARQSFSLVFLPVPASAAARSNPIATNDSMCAADGSAMGAGGGG
ncbi:unnamed protein product [Closterium sp. NIES-54]